LGFLVPEAAVGLPGEALNVVVGVHEEDVASLRDVLVDEALHDAPRPPGRQVFLDNRFGGRGHGDQLESVCS
jgi:hypothetical protein